MNKSSDNIVVLRGDAFIESELQAAIEHHKTCLVLCGVEGCKACKELVHCLMRHIDEANQQDIKIFSGTYILAIADSPTPFERLGIRAPGLPVVMLINDNHLVKAWVGFVDTEDPLLISTLLGELFDSINQVTQPQNG